MGSNPTLQYAVVKVMAQTGRIICTISIEWHVIIDYQVAISMCIMTGKGLNLNPHSLDTELQM